MVAMLEGASDVHYTAKWWNTSNGDAVIEEDNNRLRHTLYYIRISFLPIVLAGTITNILNFIVLSRSQMRKLSTSVYLLALAFADLGVMYFELFRVWFEWMNLVNPAKYFTAGYCKFANFSNGLFRDYSNWLIACLAVERLMMLTRPYKARRHCTIRNARIVCCTLALCIALAHVHCILYSKPSRVTSWVCWEDSNVPHATIIVAVAEFVVGYIVVLVVFVLNLMLVSFLYRSDFSCLHQSRPESRTARIHGRRLTRTLILIAIMFLVCETPRVIVSIIRKVHQSPAVRITLNISFLISGVNHASNFFIYILSSPRFRTIFFNMVPYIGFRAPPSPSPKFDPIIINSNSQ